MQDPQTLLGIAGVVIAWVVFLTLRKGGRRTRPARRPRWSPQGDFTARVAHVIDGDTVDVTTGRRRVRIRLDSIDCPEDGQPWGDTARHGLIKLIGGRTVHLENHGVDCHGRTLATIYLPQDGGAKRLNVNERMVALGHAWVMRRFYNHLPRHRRDSLNRIESWAKSKKVGLWRTANPVPPWKWRSTNPNGLRRQI